MTKFQLLDQIQAMESQDVKALVLAWLTGTDGNLADLEQMLDGEEIEYGEINDQGNFQPLTEAEMAAESLRVLEECKRNRDGVSHDRGFFQLDVAQYDKFLEILDQPGSRDRALSQLMKTKAPWD